MFKFGSMLALCAFIGWGALLGFYEIADRLASWAVYHG